MSTRLRLVTALAVVSAAGGTVATHGGAAAGEPAQGVRVLTSGNHSELVRTIPITRKSAGAEREVMRLPTGTLGAGDRLRVSAELEVSVGCRRAGPRCIGRPYTFSPRVFARAGLFDDDPREAEALALGSPRALRCSQSLPDRNHHCVLVLPERELPVSGSPACDTCFVSLLVSASHPRAAGERLIIGSDDRSGRVHRDKGRINLTVLGEDAAPGVRSATRELVRRAVPIADRGDLVDDQVVYSLKLDDLRAGEQLVVDGSYTARIGHLPYSVFVGTELVLSERRNGTSRFGLPERSAELRGQVGEGNGSNCTQGPSAFSDPCRVRKVGVIRIVKNLKQPLYLNLVAGMAAQSEGEHRLTDSARLVDRGRVSAVRYEPDSG